MAETQTRQSLPNYVRMHRRKAGLTQRELGVILGHRHDSLVSRHERFISLPPLVIAIGYEIVFRTPVSEIFAGVYEEVSAEIEGRLADFEERLLALENGRKEVALKTMKLEFLRGRQKAEPEGVPKNGSTGNGSGRSARSS